MDGDNNLNIDIGVFQKAAMAEMQKLREENFNLRVYIMQLQEDKKMIEDMLKANAKAQVKPAPAFREVTREVSSNE